MTEDRGLLSFALRSCPGRSLVADERSSLVRASPIGGARPRGPSRATRRHTFETTYARLSDRRGQRVGAQTGIFCAGEALARAACPSARHASIRFASRSATEWAVLRIIFGSCGVARLR